VATGTRLELAMDVEYAHAMAPGSHLIVWLVPIDSTGAPNSYYFPEAVAEAERARVRIVSNSWSVPSLRAALSNPKRTDSRQALLNYYSGIEASLHDASGVGTTRVGTTFFFASGDYGAYSGCREDAKPQSCPQQDFDPVPVPAFPPESQYVVAVGGTRLTRDSRFVPPFDETAWGQDEKHQSSGGGCSPYEIRPTWQQGTAVAECPRRAVPDVAAFARGSSVDAYIVYDGEDHANGGTSLAAPLWAGMAAELARYLELRHKPATGFMAPGLYRLATNHTTGPRDFHDITRYFDPHTTNGFPVGKGWDEVTGWGSPDLARLEEDWAATEGGLHFRHPSHPRAPKTALHITSVYFSGVGQNMHFTVHGAGFGFPPVSMPFTGNLPGRDFDFYDLTHVWTAGHLTDGVHLRYASWNDREIVVDGFSGGYGCCGWVDTPGDKVEIDVTNIASGKYTSWEGHLPGGSPSPTTRARRYTQVSAGDDLACGLRTDHTLACWIVGYFGKFFSYLLNSPRGSFSQVSVENSVACGVRMDHTLACWGREQYHMLSRPDRLNPPAGRFNQVSISYSNGCGVRTNGSPICWGRACGVENDTNSLVCLGPKPNGIGSRYWAYVKTPAGSFNQVSAGSVVACGVRIDHTLACWGSNNNGLTKPPTGSFSQVSMGSSVACGVRRDHTLDCWGKTVDAHFRLPEPPAGSFSQVSVGNGVACGVRINHTLVCWAANNLSYTHIADAPTGSFSQISAGGPGVPTICGVRTDHTVICWDVSTKQ